MIIKLLDDIEAKLSKEESESRKELKELTEEIHYVQDWRPLTNNTPPPFQTWQDARQHQYQPLIPIAPVRVTAPTIPAQPGSHLLEEKINHTIKELKGVGKFMEERREMDKRVEAFIEKTDERLQNK